MSINETASSEGSRLPIVLGVTGHRNIPEQDREQVSETLEECIKELQVQYPYTPFVAVSAMAEGADRWFAQVALKLGMPLHVVLPMPAEEYKNDFDERGTSEFDELCRKAHVISTLEQDDLVCANPIFPSDYRRELQYARVGIYLAQRCHILFALWDGNEAKGLGGTAQVVRMHLDGKLGDFGGNKSAHLPDPVAWLKAITPMDHLDAPDVGCVCHIKVRRSESGSEFPPLPESSKAHWGNQWVEGKDVDNKIQWRPKSKKKAGENSESFPPADPLLKELDTFNEELQRWNKAKKRDGAPTQAVAGVDDLATKSVANTRKFLLPIILLMIASAIVSDLLEGQRLVLAVLLAIQGVIWGLVWWALHQRTGNKEQAIDRRALAEGLRVQDWWLKAGIRDAVALRYLRHDHKDLGWVHRALLGRALPVAGTGSNVAGTATPDDIAGVTKHWVEGQRMYFEQRALKLRRLSWLGKFAAVIYFLGFGAGALALLLLWKAGATESWTVHPLSIANEMLPILAIYLFTWMRFTGLSEDLIDYIRQRDIFAAAKKRLEDAAATLAERQTILHQLGMEALNENARWANRHKSLNLGYTL